MANIQAILDSVAVELPRAGYLSSRFVGPPDSYGNRITVLGWVILPGTQARTRRGSRFDDAVTGAWEDITLTAGTLVLSEEGIVWSFDHERGESGSRGRVNATTRLQPASDSELRSTTHREATVARALERLHHFEE